MRHTNRETWRHNDNKTNTTLAKGWELQRVFTLRKEGEMRHARLVFIGVLVAALMLFLAGPVTASDIRYGYFQVDLISALSGAGYIDYNPMLNTGFPISTSTNPNGSQGSIGSSGGPTGGGQWYEYPQYWNEWWYNDPFVQPGGKWVQVSFSWKPLNPLDPVWDFHITLNWSGPNWVGKNGPPDEANIFRLTPWAFSSQDPNSPLPGQWSSGPNGFYLNINNVPIDYNPEWVSVDVRGTNVSIWGGVLEHQCVPLPAAVWLLGPGLVGLGFLRRKFKG